MSEEQFNMELRKFLKRFGVGAQHEIEKAVQEGRASGALGGVRTLKVRATLEIGGEDALVIEEELPLE
jgi:hypothetical protein